MNFYCYKTIIGTITIIEDNNKITTLSINSSVQPKNAEKKETPLLREAHKQLTQYLAGIRKVFELPLAPCGTNFQQRVWQALQSIPYGTTASYKDIAIIVDTPKGCRAVGMANNHNPIGIFIPCHRVIGSNGQLTGYAAGLEVKQKLLDLEKDNK